MPAWQPVASIMVNAALFTTDTKWMQPNRASKGNWSNKLGTCTLFFWGDQRILISAELWTRVGPPEAQKGE